MNDEPAPSFPEHSGRPQVNPLVLLKGGPVGRSLFIAHGMGGSVSEIFDLAQWINFPGSIYGLQAKGNDGVEEPLTDVEDMATYHLKAMRHIEPIGPYYLVGYSLGGLEMLEIAQQLRATKNSVALLALLDSYPHESHLSIAQRTRLAIRRLMNRFSQNAQIVEVQPAKNNTARNSRVREPSYVAWTRYQPRFYPGEIKFLRAQTISIYPKSPAAVWGHLAADIEIETVPGDHHTMLSKHSESVALIISRYVAQSVDGRHEPS